MTPQMQLNGHDPDNGIWGDCHRTCIAMILDMQAIDVPHFYDGLPPDTDGSEGAGKDAREAIYAWLAPMGLTEFSFNVPGELSPEDAVFYAKHWGNGAPVIIGGKSSLGGGHSCVAYDGQLHDPSGNGLVGPCSDGFWWFSVLAVAGDWRNREDRAFKLGES